jgi:hypothetical protein
LSFMAASPQAPRREAALRALDSHYHTHSHLQMVLLSEGRRKKRRRYLRCVGTMVLRGPCKVAHGTDPTDSLFDPDRRRSTSLVPVFARRTFNAESATHLRDHIPPNLPLEIARV